MTLKNSDDYYGLVSRANHWLSATLFIGLIALGMVMHELDKGTLKQQLYALHKSMGIALFGLVLLRLIWLKVSPSPQPISTNSTQIMLRRAVKWILYFAMLALPISGWIMSNSAGYEVAFFEVFVLPNIVPENALLHETFKTLHGSLGTLIIAVIALHIAAALKHHFIDKDATLMRMIGQSNTDSTKET